MSSLEVVATPVFQSQKDLDWLKRVREARAHSLGPPHFSLVFPGSDLAPHDFVVEVTARVAGIKRIAFTLRSALAVHDPQVRSCHVFLVPDEGFGAIVRLHEKLHQKRLATCLSSAMTYLPHITVASTHALDEARQIAAKLNAGEIAISGRIDALEVHRRDGAVVRSIANVPLAKSGLFG